jgi:hypothetical protein
MKVVSLLGARGMGQVLPGARITKLKFATSRSRCCRTFWRQTPSASLRGTPREAQNAGGRWNHPNIAAILRPSSTLPRGSGQAAIVMELGRRVRTFRTT